MIIVDTSVWIELFRNTRSPYAAALKDLLENRNTEIVLTDIILMEILQGISDDKVFEEIKHYLLEFPIIEARAPATYIHSARLYRLCIRKGLTVRKSIDLLIAAIAIENRLEVFHRDRDFETIAAVSQLRIYKHQ